MTTWKQNFAPNLTAQNNLPKFSEDLSTQQQRRQQRQTSSAGTGEQQPQSQQMPSSSVDADRDSAKGHVMDGEQEQQPPQPSRKPAGPNAQQKAGSTPANASVLQPFQVAFGLPKQHLPAAYKKVFHQQGHRTLANLSYSMQFQSLPKQDHQHVQKRQQQHQHQQPHQHQPLTQQQTQHIHQQSQQIHKQTQLEQHFEKTLQQQKQAAQQQPQQSQQPQPVLQQKKEPQVQQHSQHILEFHSSSSSQSHTLPQSHPDQPQAELMSHSHLLSDKAAKDAHYPHAPHQSPPRTVQPDEPPQPPRRLQPFSKENELMQVGKREDLSDFDKGQIAMARRLGQSISKTAALVGCSRSAVVRTNQKLSKKGKTVNRRQGHGQPRFTDACGEQRLACVVRPNRRAAVAHISEKVNAGPKKKSIRTHSVSQLVG